MAKTATAEMVDAKLRRKHTNAIDLRHDNTRFNRTIKRFNMFKALTVVPPGVCNILYAETRGIHEVYDIISVASSTHMPARNI